MVVRGVQAVTPRFDEWLAQIPREWTYGVIGRPVHRNVKTDEFAFEHDRIEPWHSVPEGKIPSDVVSVQCLYKLDRSVNVGRLIESGAGDHAIAIHLPTSSRGTRRLQDLTPLRSIGPQRCDQMSRPSSGWK